MSGPLQRFIASIGPTWIHGPNIGPFLEAVGRVLDDAVQTMYEGILVNNPLYCDADCLPWVALDRGIILYPTEPEASKRYRLSIWEELRRSYGTDRGSLIMLQPYFLPGTLPNLIIVHQNGDGTSATWHRLTSAGVYTCGRAAPSNFAYDASTFARTRWWVFIEETADMTAPAAYDDGTLYDDGVTVYDGSFTTARITDIVALLRASDSAHARLEGVALIRTGYTLNETGVSAALPDGSTTYPTGNWYLDVDPTTGLPTVPEYISFLWRYV